jgi:hypothetical protein
MNKSKRLARRPPQCRLYRRLEQADGRNEGEYRNREVHEEPCEERSCGLAQRKKALHDKQQRENRDSDERRRKIFHFRNDLYERAAAGGAGARSAAEAVVVYRDWAAFEPFGIEVPKKERRPVFPSHAKLLVEVAVINFASPANA